MTSFSHILRVGTLLLIFILFTLSVHAEPLSSNSTNLSDWRMDGRLLSGSRYYPGPIPANLSQLSVISYAPGASTDDPVIANGSLYAPPLRLGMVRLNASNVSQLFDEGTDHNLFRTAIPSVAGEFVYGGAENGNVYQYNKSNLTHVIAINSDSNAQHYFSSIVYEGYSYISDWHGTGGSALFQVNASNVTQVIESYSVGGCDGGPIINNGYLYVGCNKLYQFNATNISQLIATYTAGSFPTGGGISSANGFVYFGTEDNKVYQVNGSNVSQLIASYTTGGDVNAAPAVAHGYIYVGSEDGVTYQLNATNISQHIANFSTGPVYNGLTVTDDYLLVSGKYFYQLNARDISQHLANYSFTSAAPAVIANGRTYVAVSSRYYQFGNDLPTSVTVAPKDSYVISSPPESVTFNCTGFDIQDVDNVSLYITNSTDTGFTLNKTTVFTGQEGKANWTLDLITGNYTWNCLTYDSEGNADWSNNKSISTDLGPPVFTVFANQTPEFEEPFSYDIDASDVSPLDCFEVNDTTDFQIDCNGVLQNNTVIAIAMYHLNITVNDTVGFHTSGLLTVNVSDTTSPLLSIVLPTNGTSTTNTSLDLTYTVFDPNLDSCWYTNGSRTTNTTLGGCANITTITWLEGEHTVSIWANDTYDNINRTDLLFTIDTIGPSFAATTNPVFTTIAPVLYDVNATDSTTLDCFSVNDTTNFAMNCTGHLINNTLLTTGIYWVNITVNDTLANQNWTTFFVNITIPGRIGLDFISPTANANVTQNSDFTVSVNVSCRDADCDGINVTMDFKNVSTELTDDFESTSSWSTSTSNSNCASSGDFDCDSRSNDYDFYIQTSEYAGTYSLRLDDWDTFDYTRGLWHNISTQNDCNGFACDEYTISFYHHNYGLDASEYCIIWARYQNGSTVDLWKCEDGTSCDDGTTDSSPEANDYEYHQINLTSDGVNLTTTPIAIHIGGKISSSADYCFFDNFEIKGIHNSVSLLSNRSQTVNLTKDQSSTVNWEFNATGAVNDVQGVSVYANRTNDLLVTNTTVQWNLTVVGGTAGPSITILTPAADSFSTNTALNVNYSVESATLDSCWYTNGSLSTNTSLANCANITGVTWSEGEDTITIYANDTTNNLGTAGVTFTIDTTDPTFSYVAPVNGSITSNNSLDVTFITSDTNLDTCWYTNGSRTTNTSLASCANITGVTWSDADHVVSIWTNDSANNVVRGDRSFTIDSTSPTITIVAPTNDSSSTDTGLDITYSVADANLDSCWYTNGTRTTNTSLASCANITGVTWSEDSHVVTIWANDSANSVTRADVGFTVDSAFPLISFVNPTPADAIITSNTSVQINISFTESELDTVTYNWDGTNYSHYNDSLVLFYNFDNITSIGDNTSYVVDVSNYKNNGTFSGTTKYNCTAGKFGCAAQFASNDYINASNNESLNLGNSFTLSAWAYVTAHDNDYSFLITKDGARGGSYDLGFKGSNPYVAINDGVWAEYVTDSGLLTNGWHQLVGVRNSSDDLVIYVDGVRNKSFSSVKSPQIVATEVVIGRRASTDLEFVGLIDEVRIWNTSLSPEDVYQQYVSHLQKFNNSQWYLSVNQSGNATTVLDDAAYTYFTSVKDNSNNENRTSTRTITVDATGPVITVITPTNATSTTNTQLDVNFSVADVSLDSCWYTNGSRTTNTSLASCTNITGVTWIDGTETVTVWSNDSANLVSRVDVGFTIDSTFPSITYVNPTPADTKSISTTSLKINISITESDLDTMLYNWNGTNYTLYNDSLLLMMNFDNVSVLGENSTHVVDVSSSSFNGTIVGDTSSVANGKFGKAYSFDGTGDYINLSSIPVPNESVTVSAWINQTAAADNDHDLIVGRWGHNVGGFALFRNFGDEKLHWTISNGNANQRKYNTDTEVITLNTWHHVVATFIAGDTPEAHIYVDGVEQTIVSAEETGSVTKIVTPSLDGMIGYDVADTSGYFTGLIDEVRIWNRSLNKSEIYQLYASNLQKVNQTQWYLSVNQSKNATTLLEDGNYSYFTSVKDSVGNENRTSTRTVTVDSVTPSLTFIGPTNGSSTTNTSLDVTYSVVETNLDTCWYTNGSRTTNTTLAGCANITTVTWSDGQDTVSLWANDTANSVGTASVTFTVDSTIPSLVLVAPSNGTNTSNNSVDVTYTVSDSNLDTCWYTNGSRTTNTTLANCANITTVTWSDGQDTVSLWANDTLKNENRGDLTFTVDTTLPNVSLLRPSQGYVYNGTRRANISFNCSVTDNIGIKNVTFYLTNRTNSSFAANATTVLSNTTNYANWTRTLLNGNYTWNCLVYDFSGNSNWSMNRTFEISRRPDVDNDGLPDSTDKLLYNESNVTRTGITKMNVTVGGNRTSGTFANRQEMRFNDGATLLFNFSHNFSNATFSLRNVSIIKTSTYLIVNLSGQLQGNKTLYIEDDSFISLCVKDEEIGSVDAISAGCTGGNETDLTNCLGGNLSSNGLYCEDEGTRIRIENLQYSGVRGAQAAPAAGGDAGSGSGGGGGSGAGSGGSAGTSRIMKGLIKVEPECTQDDQCLVDEVCHLNACVKLFDVKVLDIEPELQDDGSMAFSYYLKGMANINDDVIVEFWLSQNGTRVSSGQDTIYLGEFDEKTEHTKLFISPDIPSGTYDLYVQVQRDTYIATAFRSVHIEQRDGEIVIEEVDHSMLWIIFSIVGPALFLILLIMFFRSQDFELQRKLMILQQRFKERQEERKLRKEATKIQEKKESVAKVAKKRTLKKRKRPVTKKKSLPHLKKRISVTQLQRKLIALAKDFQQKREEKKVEKKEKKRRRKEEKKKRKEKRLRAKKKKKRVSKKKLTPEDERRALIKGILKAVLSKKSTEESHDSVDDTSGSV